MNTLYSAYFQGKLATVKNLFGNVAASEYNIKVGAENPFKKSERSSFFLPLSW